jgi:hypothetical protein
MRRTVGDAPASCPAGRSVSDVIPLADAAAAVDRLHRKAGNPIRLILKP